MKMIDDWRAELNRLWSVKAAVLTALLAMAEQVTPALQEFIPPSVYAGLSILIILLRLWKQKDTSGAPAAT